MQPLLHWPSYQIRFVEFVGFIGLGTPLVIPSMDNSIKPINPINPKNPINTINPRNPPNLLNPLCQRTGAIAALSLAGFLLFLF
jgi:hypothetical protein